MQMKSFELVRNSENLLELNLCVNVKFLFKIVNELICIWTSISDMQDSMFWLMSNRKLVSLMQNLIKCNVMKL